jgi:hypothetical protein
MHKRSKERSQRRLVRKIILSSGFRDRVACEIVCRLSRQDVLALVPEPLEPGVVPDIEKGEVLANSRGTGSFQR